MRIKRKHTVFGATHKDILDIASMTAQVILEYGTHITHLELSTDGNLYFETFEVA